jgi:hypothetical protein
MWSSRPRFRAVVTPPKRVVQRHLDGKTRKAPICPRAGKARSPVPGNCSGLLPIHAPASGLVAPDRDTTLLGDLWPGCMRSIQRRLRTHLNSGIAPSESAPRHADSRSHGRVQRHRRFWESDPPTEFWKEIPRSTQECAGGTSALSNLRLQLSRMWRSFLGRGFRNEEELGAVMRSSEISHFL